ncbi:hypothetical protein FKM82_028567 [Ascaphus truei]
MTILVRPRQEESLLADRLPSPAARSTPATRIVTLPDIILTNLTQHAREKYKTGTAGAAHKFTLSIFKHHGSFEMYSRWTHNVNYEGNKRKKALPANLRKTILNEVEHYFRFTPTMRAVRDTINGLLRHTRARALSGNPLANDFFQTLL